jgi:hypothetical protein
MKFIRNYRNFMRTKPAFGYREASMKPGILIALTGVATSAALPGGGIGEIFSVSLGFFLFVFLGRVDAFAEEIAVQGV